MKRYQELIQKLNRYNEAYYTLDESLVTDEEYDRLYDELVAIEQKNPAIISPESPTQRIGGDVLQVFRKKEHTVPLQSLDKEHTIEGMNLFFDKVQQATGGLSSFTVEPKYDGIAIVLRYEDGFFAEGRTRGKDGLTGEVVTEQLKTIKSIPRTVPHRGTFEAKGEVVMPKASFHALNASLLEQYEKAREKLVDPSPSDLEKLRKKYILSNPRNGAAGAIRNLDPAITAKRKLDCIVYDLLYSESLDFTSQTEMHTFLRNNHFHSNPSAIVVHTKEELQKALASIHASRSTFEWDIDGAVVKLNETKPREVLGNTVKFPKWAMAYKFEATEKTTTLLDVTLGVGRTGKITPVAVLKPVSFEGTEVSRATLNHFQDIERKGLTIGTDVFIRRSGDVIPEILRAVPGKKGKPIQTPSHCPACGSLLIRKTLQKRGTNIHGAHLYCPNEDGCPAQSIRSIVHFASKEGMDITGLSEKTIDRLFQSNLISSIPDLYRLTMDDLLSVEGFKKQKADNLLSAIRSSKHVSLHVFLYSLGIPHIGKKRATLLAEALGSVEAFKNAHVNDFLPVQDVNDTVAESLYEYFQSPHNINLIDTLLSLGVTPVHKAAQNGGKFYGKTFVLTGTMKQKRTTIKAYIEEHGGRVSGNVSSNTSVLVAGENAGSKLIKARSLRIPVWSEEDLWKS
ncbi:NAD-dependent DNA ligase LigA (plasmid) [Pontibacillus sp. ALD_SL1]|uniref:NAD-dependent DNA ligase LigA n=1 Tax=Pontibacillus sp. ALD_SL1 TaxID=2777185 RepID=UPI001A97783C|nr:NAD-dependent DNA ligase LigA [Pontibacillus sp. ALD_SL1]QST02945.1 NAD-dependent DNA ligase LigA [Pontibacillus sp. ALD_SL1]